MPYELKITLLESEPAIWRRVLIDPDMSFEELHFTVQAAMGWEVSHLFAFRRRGFETYITAMMGDMLEDDAEEASEVKVSEWLKQKGDKVLYEYDFGDGWMHDIVLDKIVEGEIPETPRCLAGECACPPEDCGGIGGYYNLVEAINDPKHAEHKEMREWIGMPRGEKWDVTEFVLEEANERIAEYLSIEWFEDDEADED
ncbi:MAG: plasmid pRiA4b ORF-3 family protein [Bacteroidetes bacterium]|nr:MAG: plasmid pRiA4b ORF-3 family protein [Bacteroidota bacterium]